MRNEVPTSVHGPMVPDPRPILFVGDIQGCLRELKALLALAEFRAGAHRLVPVGDTINRGPDSPGVLALLRECGAEPIQGNHERGLLEILRSGILPDWARAGHSAYAQLSQCGQWESAMAEIGKWPPVREGRDWVAVHAGLHPTLAPQETDPAFLTEVRWCDPAGRRPEVGPEDPWEDPEGYAAWYAHYRGTRTVIFGHWAQRGLILNDRVRGLDTGCVYGGRLTGLWWPEDRLVQVEAFEVYRPVKGAVTRRLS